MLRTTREAATERQPASLDEHFWISADVRLDCCGDLIRALQSAGRDLDRRQVTDPELILHAYAVWKDNCVYRLRGDFAFALWDAPQQKLFCARDHFGIKPFFYVAAENHFLFSNTLNCLRAHPDVPDELNDAAIGDFLLFGQNCDVAQTTFRDIRRLLPGHFLSVSADSLQIEQYWSPSTDGRIRYKHPEDYVRNFREILKEATADRLRTDCVGIFLSGGLDSGSIAATARELSGSSRGAYDLRAYTAVFNSLLPDEEGRYAQETARRLEIPISFFAKDDLRLFDRWDDPKVIPPEPLDSPFVAGFVDSYCAVDSSCRAVLSGEGGDCLMCFQMLPYAIDLLKRGEWRKFALESAKFLWVRPFPWKGIRYRLALFLGLDSSSPVFPDWIAPSFAKRLDLKSRWQSAPMNGSVVRSLLPKAYASLTNPHWMTFFELEEFGVTHSLVESRHPFLDLRMVDYLLAVPPFPWLFDKMIAREAAKARLPETVRQRSKTPLCRDPLIEVLRRVDLAFMNYVKPGESAAYVDWRRLPALHSAKNPETAKMIARALSLNFWLQSASAVRYKLNRGDRDG